MGCGRWTSRSRNLWNLSVWPSDWGEKKEKKKVIAAATGLELKRRREEGSFPPYIGTYLVTSSLLFLINVLDRITTAWIRRHLPEYLMGT